MAVFVIVAVAGSSFLDTDDDDTVVTNDEEPATEQPLLDDEPDDDVPLEEEPVVSEPADVVEGEAGASDAGASDAGAADCPPVGGTEEQTQTFDGPPPFCLDAEVAYSANVSTTAGDITIDLDQEAAPQTVNSFVFLARNNYFDDTVCHRVIQDFVAQCGDPTATGTGGPGYEFEDELPEAGQYEVGSIAMANSGPDTNGSQFFILSGPDGVTLPPDYSLFGEVSGDGDLDVIAEMNALGSLDSSGESSEELRILDVEITEN